MKEEIVKALDRLSPADLRLVAVVVFTLLGENEGEADAKKD